MYLFFVGTFYIASDETKTGCTFRAGRKRSESVCVCGKGGGGGGGDGGGEGVYRRPKLEDDTI